MFRTRKINGRKCQMVETAGKHGSEEEAISYAKDVLHMEDFEVAPTGVSTWRIYEPLEPKVEKPKKRSKKANVQECECETETTPEKHDNESGETETNRNVERVTETMSRSGSAFEEFEKQASAVEAKEVSSTSLNDVEAASASSTSFLNNAESVQGVQDVNVSEFGKTFIETLRNMLDEYDPSGSDVQAKDLAAKLDVTVNKVTGTLRSLVQKGLCTTYTDEDFPTPDGKFLTYIHLTALGWSANLII